MQDTARIARKLAALASLGLERVEAPPAVATEAFPIGRDGWKVICTRPAMGTIVSLTGIAGSQAAVEEAVGRAFAEMDRLIGFMSRYEPSSAVSHLNTAGILDDAPAEVARVVETSLQYHELTGGAFDITVAPLLELFRSRLDAAVPAEPSDAEIREALALVGARHVGVAHRSIRFARAGMTVTLDGIAKGHIVDAMARTLERHGVKRYLVNAGGDIRARGTKEGRRPWTVAVLDPRTPGQFPITLHLAGGAVATSGSYEVSFDGDMRFHHIVDAKTGRSPGASLSVSVTAPTATAADALATSVFVLGPDAGVRFVDRLRGCACLVLGREGGQWMSRRWRSAPPTSGDEAGT